MKYIIILLHVLLGLYFIFVGISAQMYTYQIVNNPGKFYSEEDLNNSGITDHIENMKARQAQSTTWNLVGILWGVFSILAAIAFYRHKTWSVWALPFSLLILSLTLFLLAATERSLVSAATAFFGAIFLLLFIIEALYMKFRAPVQ